MSEKTEYRLTIDRPVHGRMRKSGSTVFLTATEFAAEVMWGGLVPVTGPTGPEAVEAAEAADLEGAGSAKAPTRRTKG